VKIDVEKIAGIRATHREWNRRAGADAAATEVANPVFKESGVILQRNTRGLSTTGVVGQSHKANRLFFNRRIELEDRFTVAKIQTDRATQFIKRVANGLPGAPNFRPFREPDFAFLITFFPIDDVDVAFAHAGPTLNGAGANAKALVRRSMPAVTGTPVFTQDRDSSFALLELAKTIDDNGYYLKGASVLCSTFRNMFASSIASGVLRRSGDSRENAADFRFSNCSSSWRSSPS
jgi:hypothetical protein